MSDLENDKIIKLFESGQYELAYTLIDSLNIKLDYSKIDLFKMFDNVGDDNYLEIPLKSRNDIILELEFTTAQDRIISVEFDHLDENVSSLYINKIYNTLNDQGDVPNPYLLQGCRGFFNICYSHYWDQCDDVVNPVKILKVIFEL